MEGVSVGAVGAALIAGFISLFGLIITKEQKISELRQAWINDLRACLISYLAQINSLSDIIRSVTTRGDATTNLKIDAIKKLNEASHGIKLRVNEKEQTSQALLAAMTKFEVLAEKDGNLTPANIKTTETEFLQAARNLLKFEWERVKRGEPYFVAAKRGATVVVAILVALVVYQQLKGPEDSASKIERGRFMMGICSNC